MKGDEVMIVDPFTDQYFGNEYIDTNYSVQPPGRQFSENYGNPKNNKYTLTAVPNQVVRLTTVDGQVIYEGTGEEAVNKAADIVDSLNQAYGSGATWKLQTKPEGASDFSTVSQDTVAKDKKTALNSFLDVALPLAGGLLIPGLGFLGGGALAAAAGAGGASLVNSAMQSQSLDDAIKTALINAAGAGIGNYAGGQIAGALQGAGSAGAGAAGGALAEVGGNVAGGVTGALAENAVTPILVNAATQGAGNILGTAAGAGLGSVLAGGSTPVDELIVKAQPNQPNIPVPGVPVTLPSITENLPTTVDELIVEANKPKPPETPIPGVVLPNTPVTLPPDVTQVDEVLVEANKPKPPVTPVPGVVLPNTPATPSVPVTLPPDNTQVDEVLVEANKPKPPVTPVVPVSPSVPVVVPPDNTQVDEIVVSPPKKPTPPTVDTLVIPPVPNVTGGTVNTTPTSEPTNKPLDWKDAIPLVGALLGGASGGSGGTNYTSPTWAAGTAPGQIGSLSDTFRGTLPTTNLNMAQRDMSGTDWNRYGFGPEKSFFTNVPQQTPGAAVPVAVPAPVTPPVAPVVTPPVLTRREQRQARHDARIAAQRAQRGRS